MILFLTPPHLLSSSYYSSLQHRQVIAVPFSAALPHRDHTSRHSRRRRRQCCCSYLEGHSFLNLIDVVATVDDVMVLLVVAEADVNWVIIVDTARKAHRMPQLQRYRNCCEVKVIIIRRV